jgi:hypothetical protein
MHLAVINLDLAVGVDDEGGIVRVAVGIVFGDGEKAQMRL